MKVVKKNITVANRRGVHSRVATGLALIAKEHGVLLQIIHGPNRIDGSSILDVLGMALVCGSQLTVRIEGSDPRTEKALAAVEQILTTQDEP